MTDETTSGSGKTKGSGNEALDQHLADTQTPDEKHQSYLETVKRLHEESVVDSQGNTPRVG